MTAQRTTPPPRLLVVDDDSRYGKWLGYHLGVFCPDSSVSVLTHTEFESRCETDPGRETDIVLVTAFFGSSPEDPKARGLEQLRKLRMRPVFPAVICVAEEGNELTAVRALQLGAVDYLPKRLLTPDRLNTSVRLALRRLEKRALRKTMAATTQVTEAPASTSEDDTTREQPKVNGAPLPLKNPPASQSVVDIDPDEAHGRSIIEALLDPKSDVELISPAALTPATPAAPAPSDEAASIAAATHTGIAPVTGTWAGLTAAAHFQAAGAAPLASPAVPHAVQTSANATTSDVTATGAGAPAASHAATRTPGSTPAASHTSTHAPLRSTAPVVAPAINHTSTDAPLRGVAPAAAAPASHAGTSRAPTPRDAEVSMDSALSGLFAAHAAKAAHPEAHSTAHSSRASESAVDTNATQLMAPGALAAALDAAAGTAMKDGVTPVCPPPR